jgi:hypothetical protein
MTWPACRSIQVSDEVSHSNTDGANGRFDVLAESRYHKWMTLTPAPLIEPEKDRRNNWKIAALSAVAALVVGAVGAGSSVWTARVQATSNAEQGRQDFIRTQRQSAYSRFLADANYMISAASAMTTNVNANKSTTLDANKMESSFLTLDNDYYSIEIIGSDAARVHAARVIQSVVKYNNDAKQYKAGTKYAPELWLADLSKCQEDIASFAAVVRPELT